MRTHPHLPGLSVLVSIVLAIAIPAQQTIHVAIDGTPSGSGTAASPTDFATALGRVEDPEVTTIELAGGRYPLRQVYVLGRQVAGSATQPIIIQARAGQHVVFDGATRIDPSAFGVPTASERQRLAAKAQQKIVALTVADPALIAHLSREPVLGLRIDRQTYFPARFPNDGYAQLDANAVANEVSPPAVPIGDEDYGVRAGHPPYQEPGRKQGWLGSLAEPRGAKARIGGREDEMAGTWQQWQDELARDNRRHRLTGFLDANWLQRSQSIVAADASTRSLHLSRALAYGWAWKNRDKPFFVVGMLCELDAPGEWHFDPATRRLFLYPPTPLTKDTDIRIPIANGFLHLDGARHVHVLGLHVENVASGTVYTLNGTDNLVAGATIRNCTACAVRLSGRREQVRGCDLVDCNQHIALAGGRRSARELTPGDNVVDNCHCYQKAFTHRRVGIGISGVGNTLRHCLIHNSLGQSVTVRGNDHVIECNELFQIGYDEGDGGAIYAGGDLAGYGVTYRHNFFHHLMHVPGKVERSGIHLDDLQAGATCIGNVFFKSAGKGIFMNGGAGHTIRGNVFLEGFRGIYNVGHGSQKAHDLQQAILKDPGHAHVNTKENYVGRVERIVGQNGWNAEPWRSRYPLLAQIMNDDGVFGRMWPIRCRIEDNVFCGNQRGDRTIWSRVAPEALAKSTIKGDRKVTKNAFVDYEQLDLRFRKDRSGLPRIPFGSIGLYLNTYRSVMPQKAHYRSTVREFYREDRCMPGTTRRIDTARLVENGPQERNSHEQR